MSRREYSAHVMRFRRGVYGSQVGIPDHAPDCPEVSPDAEAEKAEMHRRRARGEKVSRQSLCKTRGCGGITAGCQVFLLRLSDDMSSECRVSVPRSTLAAEFGCAPARITEWVAMAMRHGYLSRVRRGRPGVTAVYQGLYVAPKVRERVPSPEVREPGPDLVRDRVPHEGVQRYASVGSQERERSAEIEQPRAERRPERGIYEGPSDTAAPSPTSRCDSHPWVACPKSCPNRIEAERSSA
ncbi:hypothetical protein GCM10027425_12310 [Alteromonas gracilis]